MNSEVEFYIMQKSYTNFARPVKLESSKEVWECPKCGSVFVKRLSDLKVYFKGEKVADYYTVSNYSIVSGEFQRLLIDAGITGFILKDIIVEGWHDLKGNNLDIAFDKLKEIKVTGRCGFLRHRDGRIVEKCIKCGAKNYKKQDEVNGLSVNLDEWDKSDMFQFRNWEGMIIVTEKVKQIIEKNNFKNINFLNIKDFKFD